MGRVVAGVALAVAFFAALFYATLSESQVECEVCVSFGGHSVCRSVSGGDREKAIRGAISNACAVLASGVTGSLKCDQTSPTSVSCSE